MGSAIPDDDLDIHQSKGFRFRDSEHGPALILTPGKAQETARFMQREGLRCLEINESLAFPRRDLSELECFPFITGLEIIHHKIKDISIIHNFRHLEHLSIQTFCDTPIDFARFKRLRHCRIYWRSGAESVFDCVTLRSLFLEAFTARDISPITKLRNLRSLTITQSPLDNLQPVYRLAALQELDLTYFRRLVTLRGISRLERLRVLSLVNCPGLKDFTGIERLAKLKRIHLEAVRGFGSTRQLARLTKLKEVYLCDVGDIDTLAPLQKLRSLEVLIAWGNTNVRDGDLSVLTRLPRLKMVAFQNRRHYSHRREQIRQLIGDET